MLISRRSLLVGMPAMAGVIVFESAAAQAQTAAADEPDAASLGAFPAQSPELVREMVGVSHGNVARVRELLEQSPALAKAAWDWGFGDWETALGAASHVGNREIAGLLMQHGARPDIFTFAMLGQLDVVRAFVAANPGVQRTHGPHGITLLAHAKAGGEAAFDVRRYLEQLGDADPVYRDEPLSDAQRETLLGRYRFGDGPADFAEVGTPRGRLSIRRGRDGANRQLFHQGEFRFHPAGAADVRIEFELSGQQAAGLTVRDGKLTFSARREAQ